MPEHTRGITPDTESTQSSSAAPTANTYLVPPSLPVASLPDFPDQATYVAEATFQEAVKALRSLVPTNDGDEESVPFWPSLPVEEDDDDEW